MGAIEEKTRGERTMNVFGATLTRGRFVKGAGALVVGASLPAALTSGSFAASSLARLDAADLDPSQLTSWLQINPDNTILYRTGRAEMGQGSASGAYAQIIA